MSSYTDYTFKFSDLTKALQAFAALRTAGILGQGDVPENMLGDPRDSTGAAVARDSGTVAWVGRKGIAAASYTDESGQTVNVPARGDPTLWYIAIRSTVTPDKIPFDPATYGLEVCDPAESAAVLGVWA